MAFVGFVGVSGLGRRLRRTAATCICGQAEEVVEVYHGKALRFGVVVDRGERTTKVWLEDDQKEITLATEQVGSWTSSGVDARPLLVEHGLTARNFLAKAPPRALELDVPYNAMRETKPGEVWATTEVAEVLGKPRAELPLDSWVMVVGWLLASDKFRFKRAAGGGWKVRPPSVVESMQLDAFAEKVSQGSTRKEKWTKVEVQFIRSLELLAAAGDTRKPSGQVKKILAKLDAEQSSEGSKTVLKKLGLWTGAAGSRRQPSNSLEGPFPEPVTKEARAIRSHAQRRRNGLLTGATAVPQWRRDMRKETLFCVDAKGAKFLDDAFSLRRLTANQVELTVYVADVDELLKVGGQMDKLARERGESLYLPTRPLHMLPPAVLEAASFHTSFPSEAIAARMKLDLETLLVSDEEVFGAVVGPVHALTTSKFEAAMNGDRPEWEVLRAAQPFLLGLGKEKAGKRHRVSQVKQIGTKTVVEAFEDSSGHRTLDAILRSAGATFRRFAKENKAALPERKSASNFALRCGTAPLRRYSDLLVQRQLKRVLTGSQKISAQNIWKIGLELERKHMAAANYLKSARQDLLLQSLADHVATQAKTGSESASLSAQVKWIGRKQVGVKVQGTGLEATVSRPANFSEKVGSTVKIQVLDLDLESRAIKAAIC